MRENKIIEGLFDLVFPPRCPVCNTIVADKALGVCAECFDELQFVAEPYCMKCGKPLERDGHEYCGDCLSKKHIYEEGRAALVYDDNMSRSIYRFKYNSKAEYSRVYGRIIYERLKGKIHSWNAQALIPVPIHKSKLKKRGYNQATLIAKELSRYCNIPVNEHIVYRKIPTEVQKNLSATERENNLKKAFIVRKNVVKLNTVIIVDDIYTTGSTIDAVARVLKAAGVEKVYYISLSIGRGY